MVEAVSRQVDCTLYRTALRVQRSGGAGWTAGSRGKYLEIGTSDID